MWRRVTEALLYIAMLCVAVLAVVVSMLLSNLPPALGIAYAVIAELKAFWVGALVALMLSSAAAAIVGPARLRKRLAIWYAALIAAAVLVGPLWSALLGPTSPLTFLLGLSPFTIALVLPIFWLVRRSG